MAQMSCSHPICIEFGELKPFHKLNPITQFHIQYKCPVERDWFRPGSPHPQTRNALNEILRILPNKEQLIKGSACEASDFLEHYFYSIGDAFKVGENGEKQETSAMDLMTEQMKAGGVTLNIQDYYPFARRNFPPNHKAWEGVPGDLAGEYV